MKFHTREIGSVAVFDLEGSAPATELQSVAWKIQKNIRRHRLQRVILNLSRVPDLDEIGVRQLLAACIRPKQSAIYGASRRIEALIEENHLPKNIEVCHDEKEVAEKFGPFLFTKAPELRIEVEEGKDPRETIGYKLERRRSHRMHVAIPLELTLFVAGEDPILTTAIATNVSEGGLYAEYLDLSAAEKIENVEKIEGLKVDIHIFKSENFSEEYRVMGIVRRREVRKRQLGVGIEFIG